MEMYVNSRTFLLLHAEMPVLILGKLSLVQHELPLHSRATEQDTVRHDPGEVGEGHGINSSVPR